MCEESLSNRLESMMGESWDEKSQGFVPYVDYEGKMFVYYLKKLIAAVEAEERAKDAEEGRTKTGLSGKGRTEPRSADDPGWFT